MEQHHEEGLVDKPNFYEILGIDRDASPEQIKSAFHRQALRWHPDRNPDEPDAEKHFKAAAEAYEILRNPGKRSLYDSGRKLNHSGTAFSGLGWRGKRGRGCGRGRGRRCARRSRQGSGIR